MAKNTGVARIKKLKYCNSHLRKSESRKLSFAAFRQFSIVLVISLYLIMTPEFMANIVSGKSFEQWMKNVLVFSSYHLPAHACGLSGNEFENANLVALRFRRASVAVPDDDGSFRFSVVPCLLDTATGLK